ncbi:MAG: hypothetical protein VCA35_17125 [Roseibacillus sp.]
MRKAFLFATGIALLGAVDSSAERNADSAELLILERRGAIQNLIAPAEGEALFRTIHWHTDFWAARKIAAKEGKPIFIWAGSGGGPVGVC